MIRISPTSRTPGEEITTRYARAHPSGEPCRVEMSGSPAALSARSVSGRGRLGRVEPPLPLQSIESCGSEARPARPAVPVPARRQSSRAAPDRRREPVGQPAAGAGLQETRTGHRPPHNKSVVGHTGGVVASWWRRKSMTRPRFLPNSRPPYVPFAWARRAWAAGAPAAGGLEGQRT